MYRSCKIYQRNCIYEDGYISETKRNVKTRWGENDNSRNAGFQTSLSTQKLQMVYYC